MNSSSARLTFEVITLFPKMIEVLFSEGVIARAIENHRLGLTTLNPRKFTQDVHHSVDDRPFGGGDGMVMTPEPMMKAIDEIKQREPQTHVIYLSPQGARLDDKKVSQLAKRTHITLICGRYAGLDQRVIAAAVDEEISVGDFVVSGGELPAALLIDAVARKIPGVLGHEQSSSADSFAQGAGLEAPQFTRPQVFNGVAVPQILTEGDHQKIKHWKSIVGELVTRSRRPDLAKKMDLASEKAIDQFLAVTSPEQLQLLGITWQREKL